MLRTDPQAGGATPSYRQQALGVAEPTRSPDSQRYGTTPTGQEGTPPTWAGPQGRRTEADAGKSG
eukprot:12480775-Alexandrium_andersonii.AAC.1